jgi:outer membrane protein OmpA-like peptidoglycan-associated protein/tetratricopeptide (TPR) repeat protein
MNKGLLFLFATFFLSVNVLAQDKSFKELYAESFSYLEVENYSKALPILLEMFEMDKKNANTAFTIGNCYMNTQNEKPRAIPYFEAAKEKLTVEYRVGEFKEKNSPLEVIRFLGQAYHVNYEFEKALEEYKTYRSILNKKNSEYWEAVTHDIRMSRNAIEFVSKPVNVLIESAGVLNTSYSEYRPKVNAEETFLYFTTRRKGESDLVDDEGKYFEDIYYSVKSKGEWTEPVRMSDSINTDSHDACLYISPDGQMMYVYQFEGGADAGGSIYESRLIGREWTKPEKLMADINSRFWETDASLNTSGNIIFFTSDRPGGTGEDNRDIWMMKKLPTGAWAKIQPLPTTVNTPYDEESPYLHPDGKTLYFSSKGHNSMGGYDVFKTELLDDGSWSEVTNLGYPVNTTGDDVFYFPSVDGKRAYFSSFRDGGKGGQDIYKLTYEPGDSLDQRDSPALAIYKGVSKYAEGNVIKDLVIRIMDVNTGEKFGEYRPNEETGMFLFVLEAGKTYEINYETNSNIVTEVIRVDENGVVTIIKEVTEVDGVLVVRDLSVDAILDLAVTNVTNTDVTNTDVTNTDVTNTDATNTDATNTDATNTDATNTDVTNTDATNTDATNTDVTNTDATNTDATNIDATNTDATNIDATNIDVTNTDATNIDATNTDATNIDATNIDATNTDATNTDVTNTDVTNIDATNTDVTNTDASVLTQTEVNNTLNTGDVLAINSVMFVYDQVKLIEESQPELNKIVSYMNEYKDAKLVINGHTDSRGEAAYNYWLSSARANKIRNYLRKAGINYSRMETHGYGESKPIADNQNSDGADNPSGRQKNRRVEFIVNK